ncbi:MAG TPA: diguanylate cyclase [Myxococcaceae bacterium]|nr:diguanylate cyclase [Myxococcaceae bacterium]
MAEQQRFTILVVDDSPSMLAALKALIEREGHQVLTCQDGLEGLAVACAQNIDLVVLDMMLPGIDGLQVLQKLRQVESRRCVPVIVLSGSDDRDKRLSAFRVGADDFVRKHPWDAEELSARISRCLFSKRRIDDLIEETIKLHKLSVTDGLTQIYNHRFFQERLRDEFRRAQRYDDPLGLVILDLDHFKSINDKHGHPVGDQVLQDTAALLRRNIRETDVLCRYGGEEFAIILPKTHLAGSLTVAERIWRDFAQLKTGPEGGLRITASLGVAGFPSRTVVSSDQLLRCADEALYRAKREGRNKICLYQQIPFYADPPPAKAG